MKLRGDFNQPLTLIEGKMNVISFQDTKHVTKFVEGLIEYSKSKSKVFDGDVCFINNQYENIIPKNINTVILNAGSLNIFEEKVFKEALFSKFEQQIRTDQQTNTMFNEIEHRINDLLMLLGSKEDNFQIDFHSSTLLLKKFMTQFKPDFHNDLEDLDFIEMRDLYLNILRSTVEENIYIVLYPESNCGTLEMYKFMEILNRYEGTKILISNHPFFITESDELFLIKQNGDLLDIDKIKRELVLFKSKNDIEQFEKTCKIIAYHEFTQDFYLNDDLYLRFIERNN